MTRRSLFMSASTLVVMLAGAPAAAAPEEIQVYLDDLVGTGNFGTDVHNNYVVSGIETPG